MKGNGEDCVPNPLLELAGRPFAELLSCICVKAFRRAEAPLSWKGGLMVPVHKKSDPRKCDGHRGILTSSTIGKTDGNAMRRMVDPNLCQEACASQQGITEGRGTEFASHAARLMMDRAALEGGRWPCSSWTRNQRSTALPRDQAKALADVLERISAVFPRSLAARAREQVEQSVPLASTLEKLRLANHLTHVLVDRHRRNSLAVEGLDELACGRQGTRPGDPPGGHHL